MARCYNGRYEGLESITLRFEKSEHWDSLGYP